MLLSHVSHTPLPDIWRMTYRQISEYAGAMAGVMKLTSPWPTEDSKSKDAMSDETAIRAYGQMMGFYRPKPEAD